MNSALSINSSHNLHNFFITKNYPCIHKQEAKEKNYV